MHPTYRVLYVCTGNSARSILAEALTRHLSGGRFEAFSGGARPRGEVHPLALELLRNNDLPTEGLRSKSWTEFAAPGELIWIVPKYVPAGRPPPLTDTVSGTGVVAFIGLTVSQVPPAVVLATAVKFTGPPVLVTFTDCDGGGPALEACEKLS